MVNNDKPGTHRELKPKPLISLTHKWLLIVYSSTYKIYQLGKKYGFFRHQIYVSNIYVFIQLTNQKDITSYLSWLLSNFMKFQGTKVIFEHKNHKDFDNVLFQLNETCLLGWVKSKKGGGGLLLNVLTHRKQFHLSLTYNDDKKCKRK